MQKRVKGIVFVVCVWMAASVAAGTLQVDDAGWKRLQRLEPGARVKLTINNETVERYFVQLNSSELVVLNLTSKNLPKGHLLRMVADNPAWMAGTSKTTYRDNDLRVGPDGLFVKDQKLAELAQVVEHIERGQVTSVSKG